MGSRSTLKILGLVCADNFVAYPMWLVMVYLTEACKLNLTRAAAIVNIWNGFTLILPLGLSFIADAFLGNFLVLSLTSISYCIGLALLTQSSRLMEVEGASQNGESLGLLVGLCLISIGIAGHLVTIQRFMAQQGGDGNDNSVYYKEVNAGSQKLEDARFLFYILGAALMIFTGSSWPICFGVSALCQMLATIWFLTGSLSYDHKRPGGSPITEVLTVFFASASKIFHRPAYDACLYEKPSFNAYKLPRTPGFRWLEKAAMILPNDTVEEEKPNEWRVCTVTQVEKTKIILRLLPAWLTVILCGVVSSTASSFFLEQAKNMEPLNTYKIKVTLPNSILLYDGSKLVSGIIYLVFAVIFFTGRRRKYAAAIGVATAMVLSILACITAARVESWRLEVIKKEQLWDKPEEKISMSMGWLIFQYILVGAVYGTVTQSMYMVFYTQAPYSMRLLLVRITNGFLGLGFIGAAALVAVVGNVSESRGGRNWFQRTSNQSRLDCYYWTLAILSAVNLVLCFLVPIGYKFRDFEKENKMGDIGKTEEEDNDEDANEIMEDVLDTITQNVADDDQDGWP